MLVWLVRGCVMLSGAAVAYSVVSAVGASEPNSTAAFAAPEQYVQTAAAAAPLRSAEEGTLDARVLLLPVNEAVLSSEASGTITDMVVTEGDRIRRGQVIVSFDCRARDSELRRALAERSEAEETLTSQRRLAEFKAVSTLQIRVSELNLEKSSAQVDLARRLVQSCVVRAPFNGRVVKLRSRKFETVSQGQPLLEVIEDGRFNARLLVPSRWLLWLRPKAPFTVEIDELGKSFPATVTKVGARIDPASQTVEVIGVVQSAPGELIAGMSGSASFGKN